MISPYDRLMKRLRPYWEQYLERQRREHKLLHEQLLAEARGLNKRNAEILLSLERYDRKRVKGRLAADFWRHAKEEGERARIDCARRLAEISALVGIPYQKLITL